MDHDSPDLRHAWMVLRATRLRLAKLMPRTDASATGYIPPVAMEQLERKGWDTARAEGAVRSALIKHFPAFADSWDAYIENRGWLIDLMGASPALHEKIAQRFPVEPLVQLISELKADPQAPLRDMQQGNLQQWLPLLQASGEIAKRGESGEHPAVELMVKKYAMHRELAKAVLLHSRIEPWWAHIALTAAWLVCALVFVAALVNPHSAMFENESVHGVGLMHYIVLPLFVLLFLGVQIWLLKVRPQRQKLWREQLARYVQACAADEAN